MQSLVAEAAGSGVLPRVSFGKKPRILLDRELDEVGRSGDIKASGWPPAGLTLSELENNWPIFSFHPLPFGLLPSVFRFPLDDILSVSNIPISAGLNCKVLDGFE